MTAEVYSNTGTSLRSSALLDRKIPAGFSCGWQSIIQAAVSQILQDIIAPRRIFGVTRVLLIFYLLSQRPLQATEIVEESLRPRGSYLLLQRDECLVDLCVADPPALLCFPKWRRKIRSGFLTRQCYRLDDRDTV